MVFSHLIYWNYPTPLLLLWLNPHELPFIFSTLVRKQFFHHLLNWSQSSPNNPHFPFIFNLQPSTFSPFISLIFNEPTWTFLFQPPAAPQTPHFLFFLLHTINTVEPRKQPRSFLAFSSPATPTQRKKKPSDSFSPANPPFINFSSSPPLHPKQPTTQVTTLHPPLRPSSLGKHPATSTYRKNLEPSGPFP